MNFIAKMTDGATGPELYRLAEAMSESQLIPPHFRGKVADVFVALSMADQLGESPIVVLQNLYIVSGRVGWSATYMIARARRSGAFAGPIDWRITGAGPKLEVTAFALLAGTDREVSASVSMAMADAECWTKNSKYKTMPELMLRYRSAAMLVRLYAPDVMLGWPIADEIAVVADPLPAPVASVQERPAARALSDAGRGEAVTHTATPVVIDATSSDEGL